MKTIIMILLIMFIIPAGIFALDCPTCSSHLLWTSEIKYEWGKMLKIYRCPAGHEAIGK
jgi:hypothetical protein